MAQIFSYPNPFLTLLPLPPRASPAIEVGQSAFISTLNAYAR